MMNIGTQKSNGSHWFLRAKVTAVVIRNPQPIASSPALSGPIAKRPESIFSAASCNGIGETLASNPTQRQPRMLPSRTSPK